MTEKREYKRCSCCVMDTTDSKISFDENGVCDYCRDYYKNILPRWQAQQQDKELLKKTAERIKRDTQGQKYNCIIGLSGGVDSSYLCYVAKELMGLNPICYVCDTGWNLKVADENIKRIVEALELDVHTETVNWEEMRDLQLAFLKSQVPYQDLPQDHAIFAGLYNYAVKNGIKYVLTGANSATECIRPPIEWVYQNDLRFIKDVHRRFGKVKLKTFPMCSMLKYRLYYPLFKGMKRIAPLDMVEYDKEKVKAFLQERFGWEPYTNKHFEDIFTRFYEGWYLPHKFGYDKRKCYLSNEILVGTKTREEALRELEQPPYDYETAMQDLDFIAGKLGISSEELKSIIDGENRSFEDYKNSFGFIKLGTVVLRTLGLEKKKFR
ncbi:MAG: N-acetyl sugar amidotransferase [Eubacteriales bacterium]|nr:N-acetyl sugar amidotransferase [Eubacteriales bacterium]